MSLCTALIKLPLGQLYGMNFPWSLIKLMLQVVGHRVLDEDFHQRSGPLHPSHDMPTTVVETERYSIGKTEKWGIMQGSTVLIRL